MRAQGRRSEQIGWFCRSSCPPTCLVGGCTLIGQAPCVCVYVLDACTLSQVGILLGGDHGLDDGCSHVSRARILEDCLLSVWHAYSHPYCGG